MAKRKGHAVQTDATSEGTAPETTATATEGTANGKPKKKRTAFYLAIGTRLNLVDHVVLGEFKSSKSAQRTVAAWRPLLMGQYAEVEIVRCHKVAIVQLNMA